jgi:hypothetical protein
MQKTHCFSLLFLLFAVSGCSSSTRLPKKTIRLSSSIKDIQLSYPTMTVWIHGTTFSPFLRYFHAGPRGLRHISTYSPRLLFPTAPHRNAQILASLDPKRFSYAHFYTYGWLGKLSFTARRQAAQDLQACLLKELDMYQAKHGIRPKLRLITHSHGGNVALNLAHVKEAGSNLVVDELILLACPVQQATQCCVKDPMFKKVYSLYSNDDLFQIADPQGVYSYESQGRVKLKGQTRAQKPFFSTRTFPHHANVVQACLMFNKRPLSHADFIFKKFIKSLPLILDELDYLHEKAQNDIMKSEEAHIRLSLCR